MTGIGYLISFIYSFFTPEFFFGASVAVLWIEFIIVAAVIVVSGTQISKYGDVIAEKTGMGRAWTGLIMLASITSLPEFVTGISAVTVADVPDIAVGDILGACILNLLILALLDPMDKGSPIFVKVGRSHVLSAGFGIILLGIVAASIVLKPFVPSFFHIGAYTPVIIFIYLVGIRVVYSYEKKYLSTVAEETVEKLMYTHISGKKAAVMYSLNALVIIIAASALPFIARSLSRQTGLGEDFMGTVFVAFTTTLPEMVVSFSAIRIGAADLALGNLLGSNMFNVALLAVDDVFFLEGPLLLKVSASHAVTGIMAILMTAIVLVSITYRPERKATRFGWDSISMIVLAVLNIYLLYLLKDQ